MIEMVVEVIVVVTVSIMRDVEVIVVLLGLPQFGVEKAVGVEST